MVCALCLNKAVKKISTLLGLPSWPSGKESALPKVGPGSNLWSGNEIPCATAKIWCSQVHK